MPLAPPNDLEPPPSAPSRSGRELEVPLELLGSPASGTRSTLRSEGLVEGELQYAKNVRVATSVLADVGATSEGALVRQCLDGDEAAWRLLHYRYYPVVMAFLRKLGVRDEEVEDACQDVFLETHRHLASFRGQAELKTWLYRLCITQARRARRRARVVEALRRAVAWLPSDALIATQSFSEERARERIDRALDRLPERERVAFVLYELEGLPGKEIARILKCPEATVWRRLHYARQSFRLALGVKDP